jgi:hypothetical protein
VAAPAAAAKSFSLPAAEVVARVQTDGSVLVEEAITFAFDGSFSGAYREIPLREGEQFDEVAVSEAGRVYRPGASAEPARPAHRLEPPMAFTAETRRRSRRACGRRSTRPHGT